MTRGYVEYFEDSLAMMRDGLEFRWTVCMDVWSYNTDDEDLFMLEFTVEITVRYYTTSFNVISVGMCYLNM